MKTKLMFAMVMGLMLVGTAVAGKRPPASGPTLNTSCGIGGVCTAVAGHAHVTFNGCGYSGKSVQLDVAGFQPMFAQVVSGCFDTGTGYLDFPASNTPYTVTASILSGKSVTVVSSALFLVQ
jgi:hypothetical protein